MSGGSQRAALALAGLGAVAGAAFTAYAAVYPAAQVWGRGFHRGPREGRLLALTFDDGPSNETPAVLEVLDRFGVPATFFVCGRNVERRPGPAREALALGHEIANHSHSHRLLLRLPPTAVRSEVARAQAVIEDRLGVSPQFFRPPFGVRSPWLPAALEAHALRSVHWTVIGHDWHWPAERIARRLCAGASPGGILCLHDGDQIAPHVDRGQTIAALRLALPRLLDDGFRFVSVQRMADAVTWASHE